MSSWQMFQARYRDGLPDALAELQIKVEAVARDAGLDFFPVHFELVDYREMSMMAAYGGFPKRYPHWRFGMEYGRLSKGYEYGLQKIYELVINTDPCVAYLMRSNEDVDQKLVMAHVYAHCDFFKNNLFFRHTNRKMLDQMANHATRVERYIERYGHERVEGFVDACLSLENLIDRNSTAIRRRRDTVDPTREAARPGSEAPEHRRLPEADDFKLPAERSYLDKYVNPPEQILAQQRAALEARNATQPVPSEPMLDILLFLLEHAPLSTWQADILSIVRDEAYYFAPQGQTKIMNEGWATFWHSRLMTSHLADAGDIIDFADHHAGTTFMAPGSLNPYKLGLELFRDIEQRWDKGQHGADWEGCDDLAELGRWDTGAMAGLKKAFEVRSIYNDMLFVDTFLTEDFCRRMGFFAYGYDKKQDRYLVESRQFEDVKRSLLAQLTNFGQPAIYVSDGNHRNRGELLLEHRHEGLDLKLDYLESVLGNLARLWGRPVNLVSVMEDDDAWFHHDGEQLSRSTKGKG